MQMRTKVFLLPLLALWIAGCGSSIVTNLTPTQMPRNQTGQYLVEMQLNSTQQTMRPDSITPYVVIGFNEYKMRPTEKMADRWETYIPVPANEDAVTYHFKINYLYNRFGKPGEGSLRSTPYKLKITS